MICEIGGQIGGLGSILTFNFIKPVSVGETVTRTATIREMEENGWPTAEAVLTNKTEETVYRSA